MTFLSDDSFFIPLHDLGYTLNSRVHWSKKKARAAAVRSLAALYAEKWVRTWGRSVGPVSIAYRVVWTKGRRRLDVDNLIGALKPVTDGLKDAGVLVKDSPDWLTSISAAQSRDKNATNITVWVQVWR
jgi:hypothetical protein